MRGVTGQGIGVGADTNEHVGAYGASARRERRLVLRRLPLILLIAGSVTLGMMRSSPASSFPTTDRIDERIDGCFGTHPSQEDAAERHQEDEAAIIDCSWVIDQQHLPDYSRAKALLERATAYRHLGKLDLAAADLDEAIRIAPTLADLHWERAILLEDMHDDGGTIAEATTALQQKPGNPAILAIRGNAYIEENQLDLAMADFNNGLATAAASDLRALLYALRGDVYLEQEDNTAALVDFQRALSLNPANMRALFGKAQIDEIATHYEAAIAGYTQMLAIDSNEAKALARRGFCWIQLGNTDKALADLNAAITLAPTYARAYNARGIVYQKLGQFDQAVANHERAIRITPNDSFFRASLSATYISMGDYGRAAAEAKEALNRADPYLGQIAQSNIDLRLGKETAALADCDQALKLRPNDTWTYVHCGSMQLAFGHYDNAISDYDAALKQQPDAGNALALRGLARAFTGDPQGPADLSAADLDAPGNHVVQANICLAKAIAGALDEADHHCQVAFDLMPTDPYTLYDRAYIDLRRGQWQDAKASLTSAAKFDCRNPVTLFSRGYAEERLGDTAEAAADYAAARSINPEIDAMQKRYGIVPGNAEVKPLQ